MRCKKCGLEQAPWKKFCGQCGERAEPEESFNLISTEQNNLRAPRKQKEEPVNMERQDPHDEAPKLKKAGSSKNRMAVLIASICVILFVSGTMYTFGDQAKQSRYEKKAKQLEITNPEKALEYAEKSVSLGGSEPLAQRIQMNLYTQQLKEFLKGQNYIEAVKTAQKMFAEMGTKENAALVSKCYISLYEQEPTLPNIKYLEAACAVLKSPENEERLQKEYAAYGKTPAPIQKKDTIDGYKDILHLDTKLLTAGDLTTYPKGQYKFIRNEIFARHGRIFTSSKYLNYFRQFSWYNPRFTDSEITLNPIEKANVNLIRSLE